MISVDKTSKAQLNQRSAAALPQCGVMEEGRHGTTESLTVTGSGSVPCTLGRARSWPDTIFYDLVLTYLLLLLRLIKHVEEDTRRYSRRPISN